MTKLLTPEQAAGCECGDQLVHHLKILDAVEDVIGPAILVYHSTQFLKEAHTPAYVRLS